MAKRSLNMSRTGFPQTRLLQSTLPLCLLAVVLASAAAAATNLTRDEKARFLRKAKIVRLRGISEGITGSKRATLTDGSLTHDAHIQNVEISKNQYPTPTGTELNFRDSYQYNLAARLLDRLLGLNLILVTVERRIRGKLASVTWWVDDMLMTEKQRKFKKTPAPDIDRWNNQMFAVRIFDQLIYNTDRNLGNLLIDKNWNLWMIDHTRAFRLHKTLKSPDNIARIRCDRGLFAGLQRLDEPTLKKELGRYVKTTRLRALLTRRDKIVEIINKQIAERGEDQVLCDIERL